MSETRSPDSLRVLVADDEADVRAALRLLLGRNGFEVVEARSPEDALRHVDEGPFDVALIDLNYARGTTSGREGLDLMRRIRDRDDALAVIAFTAWGSVQGAVEAMRLGARDYVEKPWDNARLLATLRTHAALTRAQRQGTSAAPPAGDLPLFLGESAPMRRVRELLSRVAPSDVSVLITGEHGTGKDVAARWLHAASKRCDGPLVTLNAGGLADGVFESECFGHVRGAFTDAKLDRAGCFELADGGTLFLDEIGNMPLGQQAKLLRVLETGELQRVGSSRTIRMDVRIVAATNADIAEAAREGRFRSDLLYRLNTVEVRLPPLRERREDVLRLAEHFLRHHAARHDRPHLALADDARAALERYDWPGNVRELCHVIERAVLLARGSEIDVDALLLDRSEGSAPLAELTLAEAERRLIESSLEHTGGNVTEAAVRLGLSRSALYRRLERLRKG